VEILGLNTPNKIIMHCSATADYDVTKPMPYDYGVSDVTAWHKAQGWKTCGYHKVIRRSGVIEIGRADSDIGAHCHDMNADSIGICYIGTQRPTVPQIESIIAIYKVYYDKFGIGWLGWFGHYEFNANKSCPGFSMEVLRYLLKSLNYEKGVS